MDQIIIIEKLEQVYITISRLQFVGGIVKGPYTLTKQMENGQVFELMNETKDKRLVSINATNMNIFYCGLNTEELNRIFTYQKC